MGWLDGQSILLTGGAAGLGRELVNRLVTEGANVTVLDRNAAGLDALVDTFKGRVAGVAGDVRNLADNRKAVDLAVERFGKLDTFIGNAGIWDYSVPLVDLPDEAISEAFDEVIGINLKGYLMGIKAAAPALVRSRGSVILTLSNSAFYAGGGGVLYTSAKHAVVGLIKQAAHELAPYVRVNGVAPGGIASDLRGPKALGMEEKSLSSIPLADFVKDIAPIGRLSDTEEYTGSYVYLASGRNSAPATGVIINCDGGLGVRSALGPANGGKDLLEKFGG
jgi:NAD(P)-dependent dehydrogenase (short-subunit alcohol dehydrogenase family)